MTKVKIAQLKTQLSSYIKKVRNGSEILVTDRDTPVAKIIPFKSVAGKLIIIHKPKVPYKFSDIRVPPSGVKTDILKILQDTRSDRDLL